jgi:hypothetical protein
MSDDEVARIIAEEAARRRDRAQVVGVSAYLEREPLPPSATRPGDVNKRFLGHTVNAVLGYNRRNQEEQCWQQRSLEPAVQSLGHDAGARGAKRSRSPAGAADGDRLQASTFREAAQLEQQASREAWALKKAAQAAVVQVPAAPAQAASSSDKKEAKKKGNKKEHKKEKKKRHKKERKKEKKKNCSSTENSSSESESGNGSGFIHF